jgi:polysaccharide pyruvyl transferase WcaK-like protein
VLSASLAFGRIDFARQISLRILIENSGYALLNMGDVAMLQAAVSRIKTLLPSSELRVLTNAPQRLQKFCPGCHPVSAAAFAGWRHAKVFPCSYKFVGDRAKQTLRNWDVGIRFRFPALALALMRFNATLSAHDVASVNEFLDEIKSSDVVVAAGGGYFTDSFPFHAEGILETLRVAQSRGKPTALFGQGLGPLTDAPMRKRLGQIFQHARVIGLRERRAGPAFLKSLGVDPARVRITGDDAIELAHAKTPPAMGGALGLNVRVTEYSGVTAAQLAIFHSVLPKLLQEFGVPLLSIPIETKPADSDVDAIRKAVPGNLLEDPVFTPEEPSQLVERTGRCRLVITGSYHAGVFALAQGIPVVGLIGSEYYADKFLGLQTQFGEGVCTVNMAGPDAAGLFEKSVRRLWTRAEFVQEPLLKSAKSQIQMGWQAFRTFFEPFA